MYVLKDRLHIKDVIENIKEENIFFINGEYYYD